MKYTGPSRRLAAFAIDLIVMMSFYMIFSFLFGVSLFASLLTFLPMVGFWFYGGIFFLSWIYCAGFESSSYQATIGKRLLRLKVATLEGGRITFLRASVRYFSKIFSRLFLMFGFLMIPFTKKKQGLHDKIARTVILKVR